MGEPRTAYLPGILAEIADLVGEAAALQLAREAGGTDMKFSGRPGGALARIVGAEKAAKIASEMGGETRTIPMANLRGAGGRRAAIARALASGASNRTAAIAGDVHHRTAKRLRRKLRENPLPLFEK